MSERGRRLAEEADRQISELIELLYDQDDAALSFPCPAREKLGDGTVAACAQYTADTYRRIAAFVHSYEKATGRDAHNHDMRYSAQNIGLPALLQRLSAARDAVKGLAGLTDERLDTVPPAGAARFCDGQRTLEQVLTGMLRHQRHQIGAVRAALEP